MATIEIQLEELPVPDLLGLCRKLSDERDHREISAAKAEHVQLCMLMKKLGFYDQAASAGQQLRAAGINFGDEAFSMAYLNRNFDRAATDALGASIDGQVVHRLELKTTPVIRRIQRRVIEALDKDLARPMAEEIALAERYGLPRPALSRTYRAIIQARNGLHAELESGGLIDLKNIGANRLNHFDRYFAKPL